MRRRSTASSKLAKARNRKAVRHGSSSASSQETEVARLTRERDEALEQQAATGELLKVISSSKFDLQPVLDTLLETAARLCAADIGVIRRRDGDGYSLAATIGYKPEWRTHSERYASMPTRGSIFGRTVIEGRTVHIPDVLEDPEFARADTQSLIGFRAALGVPLLREGNLIGIMAFQRFKPGDFTPKQIELVETFAAQAVIAIENARLLDELKQSLDQQIATSEVLTVISSSPGDLKPVFNAMLENAVRLCEAEFGHLFLHDGEAFHATALHSASQAFTEVRRRPVVLRELHPDVPLARVVRTKEVIHVADVRAEKSYVERDPTFCEFVDVSGARACLQVPMLKENELIGALVIYRLEVRPFTGKQIELVKNFAAQAVIAIENARLLDDLNKLNQQLEQRVSDQVGEIERMGRLRRFLPPQVADLIVASGTEKQLESHRREITALFCDLRGFTGFSESSDREDVMALLREYHAAIGEIIIKYSGTLERYAGDGVMVVFNDPVPVENPAFQAVLMALDMRTAIGTLIDKWRDLGHDLGFGIGIAHGFATLGTIGFEGRFDYAAIGTVSNVASRLCDEAKPGQILISPRVRLAVEKVVTVEPIGEFTLKGIRRPMVAYNVLAFSPSKPN
jgi:class 3 adenylate cyclase/putative methionine-R-sulfoxide reductase with GAF domain